MSARSFRRVREHQSQRAERRTAQLTRRAAVAGATVGATVLFAPGAAQAASFSVDTLADSAPDGCNNGAGDECTLREAVEETHTAAGADTITFESGLSGTIDLEVSSYGPLFVGGYNETGGVHIQGPGADQITISGQNEGQIFKILGFNNPGVDVTFSGLTLRDGEGLGGGAVSNAVYYYSGANACTGLADVEVSDSVLTANYGLIGGALGSFPVSYPDPTACFGMGPADFPRGGAVTLTNSQVTGNQAEAGAGLSAFTVDGDLTIADSQLTGNAAESLGAAGLMNAKYGEMSLTGSTVANNNAEYTGSGDGVADGGGIIMGAKYGSGVVENTTVANNSAQGSSGGLSIEGPFTISNSTISGNKADADGDGDGYAGGLYLGHAGDPAEPETPTRVINSTVAGNSAATGGGVALYDFSEGGRALLDRGRRQHRRPGARPL